MHLLCHTAVVIGYGHQAINETDIEAVCKVLRGEALTCGPTVAAFEQALAQTVGARHVIAVSNGTSALRMLYAAHGIGPGIRVGVPAVTFVTTASQVLALGAEVVLLDVDPKTGCLGPEQLAAYSGQLDWVVPVHMAGRLCDMDGIAAIAQQRGIRLLEDAAHAFGSQWQPGTFAGVHPQSEGAIYSFHPVKNICCGEGGAIVCGDDAIADRIRSLRHCGIERHNFTGQHQSEYHASWYHEFHHAAGNDRLSDIHAALGLSQLQRWSAFKAERQAIWQRYYQALAPHPWLHLAPEAFAQSVFWHLCLGRIDVKLAPLSRQALMDVMRERGFALQVHYIPLHYQPLLHQVASADLSGAEAYYRGTISLPCFVGLAEADQMACIDALHALV